jgi:sugar-specific transcriptional regulator TrmB
VAALLEEEEEKARVLEETEGAEDAWVIRGERAVREKAAELILSAKKEIIALEAYPSKYLFSIKSLPVGAQNRKVRVKAVSMVKREDTPSNPDRVIEFRIVSTTPLRDSKEQEFDNIFSSFKETMKVRSLLIVDGSKALNIVRSFQDSSRISALLVTIPGLPMIQGAVVERMLKIYTKGI